MRIDKIYILSLNPTQETINKILSKLELIKLKQNIPYDIKEGHDGWNLPVPDGVHLWEGFGLGDKTDNEHWKLPMQPGEVGCALSHIKAWHRVATGDEERVLILEEDFTPIKPLSNLPEPNTWWPFQWDFCSLGRWVFDYSDDIKLDEHWCIPSRHYNMHAYILTKLGAQKLVDYQLEKKLIPNDEFITATYMKHVRTDIDALFPEKRISAIATHLDWFDQDESPSRVSSHSPQYSPDSRM